MQLYGKTSGLLRSEVWFKEVEFQTGDKIKTSILGTPFLCVNILHVAETRHNTTKRVSSSNVRKWAITLKISFEGECKLKWKKKKRTKRKEKKEKDRKESARLGLEPYTFGLWRSRFLRSAKYAVWLFSQVWHGLLFVNSSAFYTTILFFTAILYNYTTVRTYSHRPPLVFCVNMLNVVETRSCKEVMAH